MCVASKHDQENLQEIAKLKKENQELQASHKIEVNELQASHKSEVKKLCVLHQEELKSMEKKSRDSTVLEFLDSQDYKDRMEKHFIDYRASPEFEDLVEDRSLGYFDEGYDRALSYVKKKYPSLNIEDLLQGRVPSTPLHSSSSGVSPENEAA
ncbi:hypothetical protein ACH5RR_007059 [Cinchona calisaya]|uniref:Uncharacterized protein n=1 Tax=Cinchona calisaya TaxID=153742 RepID=A0ABD3AR25_9GENT